MTTEDKKPIADKTQALLELAQAFIRSELLMEAYYQLCVDWVPEFKDQWFLLSAQERGHAGAFKKIMESIQKEPGKWRPGNYLARTVNMMSDEVSQQMEDIKKGNVVKRRIVTFITGMETSMIESDLGNAFHTSLPEFTDMLSWLAEETAGHREILMSIEANFKG